MIVALTDWALPTYSTKYRITLLKAVFANDINADFWQSIN